MIEQIRDGKRQAQRLAAPAPMQTLLDSALVARVQGNLDSARLALDQLASKPQPPFSPQDAGLTIAASPTLVESLVLPLLQARFADATVTAEPDARRWFIATTDPAVAPGAVVSIADAEPYGPLLDGSADLVLTDQPPDATVRARFAAAFGGQELDARAFSEVVALDAVVLLAHPDASAAPVDLGNLARGPWLVRSPDADSIRRLTIDDVSVKAVQDPFQALLAQSGARALAFYHQSGPSPRGKYLPFKAAAKAQAVTPSRFSIATEDYRWTYRIRAAHSPQARPAARQFMEYLTSDAGQEQIAGRGFVDLRLPPDPAGPPAPPGILAILATALGRDSISSASRYPTNLHFGVNQSELDIKAKADIGRLERDFPSGKVVILGFTDNTGGVPHNVKLSKERAQSIARMLQPFKIDAAATGLGQEFPVDTNDTEQGRARNRRAEVWVVKP
ncbi:MAG TPA: OmpA family protein [Lamprocystis sp. (in: g-proteobacteria)]|nr:OmpA family protein [Lamprocystis sp. (in: g-proteobacteria)]